MGIVKGCRWLVAVVAVGLLSACVTTTPNLTAHGNPKEALSSGDTSVVFGRIQWMEHGKEKPIGKGLFAFSVTPNLLRIDDKSRLRGEVDTNGEFMWTLKPGIYVINKIDYRDPWSGNYFTVPQVAFRVPQNGHVYYLGTLRAEFASKRDFIGGLSGRVKIQILDNAPTGYGATARKLGISPKKIEKSLMVHVSGLPRTIDTTKEFNLTVQVLNAVFFGLSH